MGTAHLTWLSKVGHTLPEMDLKIFLRVSMSSWQRICFGGQRPPCAAKVTYRIGISGRPRSAGVYPPPGMDFPPLPAIKTGTATSGGASSSVRANVGVIKALQGGTGTVAYVDTASGAPISTKTLSFSSFNATIAFDADTYVVGSYAGIILADAERNADSVGTETLVNDVFIETSSFNVTKVRLVETGVDTGAFAGSIRVADIGGTQEFERIQAAIGDTLKISYLDNITTFGTAMGVTDTAFITAAVMPTPTVSPVVSPTAGASPSLTPTASPKATPVASPTPTPACEASSINVSDDSVIIQKKKENIVTITVKGNDGCLVEGENVTASIDSGGRDLISITQKSQKTDAKGKAKFKIKAKNKFGETTVTFTTENGLSVVVGVTTEK